MLTGKRNKKKEVKLTLEEQLNDKLLNQDVKLKDLVFMGIDNDKNGVCMIARADNKFQSELIELVKKQGFKFEPHDWILSDRLTAKMAVFTAINDAFNDGIKTFLAKSYKAVDPKTGLVVMH